MDLLSLYPLGASWSPPNPFFETANIGGCPLHLAGFSVCNERGDVLTGSAASTQSEDEARSRAYFELIERTSLFDAIPKSPSNVQLLDRQGRPIAQIASTEAFPVSQNPVRWLPSKSNGVAVHQTWATACDRAWAELVERDRVLRSWYGEMPLTSALLPELPTELESTVTWVARALPPMAGSLGEDLTVGVVVGFPKHENVPLTIGYGAAATPEGAMRSAASEAVQRLGFLFGEEIPETEPRFNPSPDYHQEFYLCRTSHQALESWLEDRTTTTTRAIAAPIRPTGFIDVTPEALRGKLWVAKAVCDAAEPLIFGETPPHRIGVRTDRRVHPIA